MNTECINRRMFSRQHKKHPRVGVDEKLQYLGENPGTVCSPSLQLELQHLVVFLREVEAPGLKGNIRHTLMRNVILLM